MIMWPNISSEKIDKILSCASGRDVRNAEEGGSEILLSSLDNFFWDNMYPSNLSAEALANSFGNILELKDDTDK